MIVEECCLRKDWVSEQDRGLSVIPKTPFRKHARGCREQLHRVAAHDDRACPRGRQVAQSSGGHPIVDPGSLATVLPRAIGRPRTTVSQAPENRASETTAQDHCRYGRFRSLSFASGSGDRWVDSPCLYGLDRPVKAAMRTLPENSQGSLPHGVFAFCDETLTYQRV